MMYNHLFYYFFKKYNKILDGIASVPRMPKRILLYILYLAIMADYKNFFK